LRTTTLPVTGNTELTKPENRAFYPALDGLRAIAFLLVFFQHYCSFPWGWSGVNVFFVLSGFLITGILFDSRGDAHRARNFYMRRVLRIFPLFYGVCLAVVLLDPIFHWRWSLYWLAWPLYLANLLPFASNAVLIDGSSLQLAAFAWLNPAQLPRLTFYLGHFWSLCVEEQFYFLWPWVVFWTRSRRTLIYICVVVVVLVPISRVLFQHHAPTWMLSADLLDRATPFQLDSLLLGGLVALLLRGPRRELVCSIGKVIATCIAFVVFVVFATGVILSYPNWRAGYVYPDWKFTWGLTLIDVFSAAILLVAVQPSSLLCRSLSLRPLRWVGRISYGAYVFHDIFHYVYLAIVAVLAVQSSFVANHFTFFLCLLGLTATLLISWISFECFESRFLNLKERWTVSPTSRVAQTLPSE
jgi:peptidoglycan/LPS O-acetylase OafA/YrhL